MKIVAVEEVYQLEKGLKKEHVLQLMEWIEKQPHLPKYSEFQVARFLWSCNYNSELAKVTIENNATMRTHCPEIFQNRCIDSVRTSLQTHVACMLPKRSPDGCVILFSRLLDFDPAKYNCAELHKKMDMLTSIWCAIVPTCTGHISVLDSTGTSMGHFTKLDFAIMKKYSMFAQNAMPVRPKAMHIINSNPVMEKCFNFIKPLLKGEMIDMIMIHRKVDTLFKYVPQECLPNEYGGRAGTLQELNEIENQRLVDYADYLRAEEKLVVDESKRVGKSKNASEVFGIEGTFKKLDID